MSEDQNQGRGEGTSPAGGDDKKGRERRLHLQAYEYWYSLLGGRRFPSIADMDREQIDRFRAQSFLVDFPQRYGDPILRFIGEDIVSEYTGNDDLVGTSVNKIPRESILSRLSIHYMEVLSNRAPISFEAEFESSRGGVVYYRGILMPFSDDDEIIHFILGILTWEHESELATKPAAFGTAGVKKPAAPTELSEGAVAGATSTSALHEEAGESPADAPTPTPETAAPPAVAAPAELPAVLKTGRDRARSVSHVDARSRDALYQVLADALALYEAGQRDPEAYQQMLAEAGIRQQARAPLTPAIKLIFGSHYDKTRITEYAAALRYALAQGQTSSTVKNFIANHEGGIKGCVREARLARRAARGDDGSKAHHQTLSRLRGAAALGSTPLDHALSDADEFLLLLGRRSASGRAVDIVAVLDEKQAALENYLRRASRQMKQVKQGGGSD